MPPFGRVILLGCVTAVLTCAAPMVRAADPLASWNDGPAKTAILEFVGTVTRDGSPAFVPVAERIATFDNDGTLWAEQPAYFQLLFVLDRVKALAPGHPEWKGKQPFKAALEGDVNTLAASGEKGLLTLVAATHANTTTDEFAQIVKEWLGTARHPKLKRPYTDLVFQPMLELLAYLRANAFQTYIVSGGGIEFLRVFAEERYGVPPQQVVGSSVKTKYVVRNGTPAIVRLPQIDFIDDKAGKPVGIHKFIGRRPIFAFGNSDGDLQMLEWTAAGGGARFMGIVHHTDARREWAYDRQSPIGRLDKALDEARARRWTVVDMQRDWKRVFPFGD